jgi:hypothetical protein
MRKVPDAKLADLIQEVLEHTEQPIVLFVEKGELQMGVLEGMSADLDWYFTPVRAIDAEKKLGVKELSKM